MSRILAALLTITTVWTMGQIRPPIRIVPAAPPAENRLLEIADLECDRMFISPNIVTGLATADHQKPMTFRREGADRVWYVYDAGRHIRSFTEPAGSPCDTAFESIETVSAFAQDWGELVPNRSHPGEGDVGVPGFGGEYYMYGLNHDVQTDTFIAAWLGGYSTNPPGNSLVTFTLDSGDHSIDITGCHGILDFSPLQVGHGVLMIPPAFVAEHLPAGYRWAVWGGWGGYAGTASYGPSVNAIAPPAPNACASDTDYDISPDYVTMQRHQANNVGPTCHLTGIGCTPSVAPTTPYPAKMDYADYSVAVDSVFWDPWYITGTSGPKHGWFTWETTWGMGWYKDDRGIEGIFVPIFTPSGWLSQSVLASPAPTYSAGTGSFSIASTSTNDGYHIGIGDRIWVETCTVGVDPPGPDFACDLINGHNKSFVTVTSVNTGTGAITYDLSFGGGTDQGGGDHVPIVPGSVQLGAQYGNGAPIASRLRSLIQIYDPAQWGEVIAETREVWEVEKVEESSGTNFFPLWGGPELGFGIRNWPGAAQPAQVIIDADEYEIIVPLTYTTGGNFKALFHIFKVAEGAAPRPKPQPLPWYLPVSAGAAMWALPGLFARRR